MDTAWKGRNLQAAVGVEVRAFGTAFSQLRVGVSGQLRCLELLSLKAKRGSKLTD